MDDDKTDSDSELVKGMDDAEGETIFHTFHYQFVFGHITFISMCVFFCFFLFLLHLPFIYFSFCSFRGTHINRRQQ